MKFKLLSLNIGKIDKLKAGSKSVDSGYHKSSVDQALLGSMGLKGDEQEDLKHHGGVDKAVCVFSSHHFPIYEELLKKKMPMPSFGENFTIDAADEQDLFIGDIFECREIKLQISQPRQPCSKTGMYHGNNAVIKLMSTTGSTGFYFRVLSGGLLYNEDEFVRSSSDKQYSLRFANDLMYRRNMNDLDLRNFIKHPALSEAWRDELGARIK